MKAGAIIHENGLHWVSREGPGHFKVWEVTGVASYRRGTYHFSSRPEYALERAIGDCNRREQTRLAAV